MHQKGHSHRTKYKKKNRMNFFIKSYTNSQPGFRSLHSRLLIRLPPSQWRWIHYRTSFCHHTKIRLPVFIWLGEWVTRFMFTTLRTAFFEDTSFPSTDISKFPVTPASFCPTIFNASPGNLASSTCWAALKCLWYPHPLFMFETCC